VSEKQILRVCEGEYPVLSLAVERLNQLITILVYRGISQENISWDSLDFKEGSLNLVISDSFLGFHYRNVFILVWEFDKMRQRTLGL